MVDLSLLPTPQFIAADGQGVSVSPGFALEIITGPSPDPKVHLAANLVKEHLDGDGGGAAGTVRVVEHQGRADCRIVLMDVQRQQPAELSAVDWEAVHTFKQGYVLRVQEENTVYIWGLPQGLLWGAATLLQLIGRTDAGLHIPGVYIRDYPHFEFRVAADWMTNAEANRSSMDRGRGWQGFENVCKRKIDQCLRYKINAVLFDGFGWSLSLRAPEYPGVVSRITRYARQRGIHLSFGGYGAGYGMAFQKGPLYEDAQYLGQVWRNQVSYPDGAVYPCTGETRAHAVRKGVDTRVLGTCRSNEALNQLKARELQEFVRAVEPGMLYIHHEDYGSCRTTEAAWQVRCERCRERWPNDAAAAPDGAAGAIAEGYGWLINAVNEVRNPDTGYEAGRDCQILLVSPVYCLSDHTQEAWDAMLRFWQCAGKQLPAAANVMVCFRETFALDGQSVSWTEAFNTAMREAGVDLGSIMFFITGGDHWLNDYPFVGGSALNNLFAGARAIFHDNGNAYQEPLQLLNAKYCWNVNSTGYAPRPGTYQETWDLWTGLSENEIRPAEIYGNAGLLHKACDNLYGERAAGIMAEYFSVFGALQVEEGGEGGSDTQQDAAPERKSYLPMTSNKVHALPILWRALALDSKTWAGEIDNERMLTEMARLKIDRPELHRRLVRRWTLTSRMLQKGGSLLQRAMQQVESGSIREELQFLLDATCVKLPLTLGLAKFHEAILEMLGSHPDRQRVASLLRAALAQVQEASALAERHYPSVVDPVGEVGAVKTYLARVKAAIETRLLPGERNNSHDKTPQSYPS